MPREVSTRSSPVSKVNDGWTHTIHSIAGPSSPPGDYPSYKIHRLHWADETFAERFKYAICSSGVLEKEHVPGLGGLDRGDVNDTLSDTSDAAESRDKPATSNVQYTMSAMGHRAEEIGELGLRRWDIVLAVLVLFCALGSLMGVRLLVIGSLSIAGIAGATCAILNPPTWKVSRSAQACFAIIVDLCSYDFGHQSPCLNLLLALYLPKTNHPFSLPHKKPPYPPSTLYSPRRAI